MRRLRFFLSSLFSASLSDFSDLPGRGKTFDLNIGGHPVNLIDDSYNAGPTSMKAALETLAELPGQHGVILSDMLELGVFSTQAHQALVAQIIEAKIRWVVAIGPQMTAMIATIFLSTTNAQKGYGLCTSLPTKLNCHERPVLQCTARFSLLQRAESP